MKQLILLILIMAPTLVLAHGKDIYAEDQIHGEELIEMVRDEGTEVSSSGTSETYKATIECSKDKINSKLSYCAIKGLK